MGNSNTPKINHCSKMYTLKQLYSLLNCNSILTFNILNMIISSISNVCLFLCDGKVFQRLKLKLPPSFEKIFAKRNPKKHRRLSHQRKNEVRVAEAKHSRLLTASNAAILVRVQPVRVECKPTDEVHHSSFIASETQTTIPRMKLKI